MVLFSRGRIYQVQLLSGALDLWQRDSNGSCLSQRLIGERGSVDGSAWWVISDYRKV